MAIELKHKQYNIAAALIGFSSDLGNRLALLEEELAEYTQAAPFTDGIFEDANNVPTIGHINANDLAVLVNAYNALAATGEFTAWRAAMRKAAP